MMGDRILRLEGRLEQSTLETYEKQCRCNTAATEKVHLEKEILVMEARLANGPPPTSRSRSPSSVVQQTPSASARRRDRQYQRFFAERIEREELAIAKRQRAAEKAEQEYETIMVEMGNSGSSKTS